MLDRQINELKDIQNRLVKTDANNIFSLAFTIGIVVEKINNLIFELENTSKKQTDEDKAYDEHLINVYLLGYKDKLDNSDNIPEYNDGLSLYAYKLGRTHARSRIDYRLTLDEILNSIKKSQV